MGTPRLLIADHHLVADGLRRIFEARFDVVGTASSGPELLQAALQHKPDLITLEVSMPGMNGIDTAMKLRMQARSARLVFITQQSDAWIFGTALRIGVCGYILKQQSPEEVCDALGKVAQGHTYVAPQLRELGPWARGLRAAHGEDLSAGLTTRQRQVLQLLAEGRTTRQIGETLGVSPKTAEFHRAGLMEALGLRTVAQLTRFAIEHGLAA